MLPKILHQIWLGSAPMHERMVTWRARWRELHPDWTFKCWTGDIGSTLVCGNEKFESRNPDLLQRACHYAQRANIWRLELLLAQGGVYIDTDMEPLKPIDSLLVNGDAFSSPFWAQPTACNNAFLASVPGHGWMRACVDGLTKLDPTISLSMGSRHITAMLKGRTDVVWLPPKAIYQNTAWSNNMELLRPLGHPFYSDIHAIHHFSYLWHPTGFQMADGVVRAGHGK